MAAHERLADDLGTPVSLPSPPRRVVSLVPSLTEAIAATGVLVGATEWCTHPTDLDVPRFRGTKNPDTRAIAAADPDLVVVNKEENRELDVQRLRAADVPVWVTDIQSVPQALASLRRLFSSVLQLEVPGWLDEADELWAGPVPAPSARVAVPIWRDPWMVVGRDTFCADLLARLGMPTPYATHDERYPTVTIAELEGAGLDEILLPDEPYVFTADDGPQAFTTPTRLVSGRLLTWYGPSLVDAATSISREPGRDD